MIRRYDAETKSLKSLKPLGDGNTQYLMGDLSILGPYPKVFYHTMIMHELNMKYLRVCLDEDLG